MSLLEQKTTKKEWLNKEVRQIEFDTGINESGKYKIEAIRDNAVYMGELKSGYLPDVHYLVS